MADTELDEVLTRLYATGGFNLDGTSIAHKRVEPLELGEAKQKLLKLIDKEVTRSRIDELEHMENEMWYEDDHVTSKGSRTERIPQLKAELEKLEEGTDNG